MWVCKIGEIYKMDMQVALSIIMPYGKFKGKLLDDIPSKYLKWVAENYENEIVAVAADVVWNWREEMNAHLYD